MGLIYKPIGIVLGLLGGIVGRQLFNFVWGKVDDEEPPEATTLDTSWRRLLAATAIQGLIFATAKAVVKRYGALGWRYLTGHWPGEIHPEPE